MLKNIEVRKYIDLGDLVQKAALTEAFDRSLRNGKEDASIASKHKFPINTPLD